MSEIAIHRTATTSALSLAYLEIRSGFRGAAFRFLMCLALVIGWVAGSAPGQSVALSAWLTGDAAWRYLSFIVIVWMSLTAVQDSVSRTDLIVYSKPQPTERLVLARFMSAFGQALCVLTSMYIGAILSRVFSGEGMLGFSIYPLRWFHSACVLFFTASASYSLATLFRTPLAGTLIGLYWLLTLAGKNYLSKAFFPAYTQNMLTYVCFGMFLLSVACLLHRRARRGRSPVSTWVVIAAPVALLGTAAALITVIRTGHEPSLREEPALLAMAAQNAELGSRAPGFRLPDAYGKLRSLADYAGKVLVIALWSPTDPDSSVLLDQLRDAQKTFGPRGVQVVAVCVGEDDGAAAVFGRGGQYNYPVVLDWSTHNAEKVSDGSALANAYQVNQLPHIAITDRRRKIRHVISGALDERNLQAFQDAIKVRLDKEPD